MNYVYPLSDYCSIVIADQSIFIVTYIAKKKVYRIEAIE